MKEMIIQTLKELRAYALTKGCEVDIFLREEESYLMRFANSAISLNTNEHLIRLDITAYDGRKRAAYALITDLSKFDEMKKGVDVAAEMVKHAQPLSYDSTIPVFTESFADDSNFDPTLAHISNEERLQFFNTVAAGLETEDIKLSGIFSNGANTIAQINTKSEHTQYFKMSDAQVTVVLAHGTLKWEVQAEASAQRKSDLDPAALNRELVFLLNHYQNDPAVQLPLGEYDVVFGPAAIADMLNFMNFIGWSGGNMKRGFSFMTDEKVGQKVFSSKVSIVDDPTRRETFPFARDLTGIVRKPWPLFEQGTFKGFVWFQDDADEFGVEPTGHTVMHRSLVLKPGDNNVSTLEELAKQPRERDILYVPFLHYMNIVNPSKAIVTASSRFGALLFKKDGSVAVPYNVRLTQSLLDVFGDKVAWLSKTQVAYNTSQSYGARNATAIVVPAFMQVDGLAISHSNSSY